MIISFPSFCVLWLCVLQQKHFTKDTIDRATDLLLFLVRDAYMHL
jgi:hypothetical protein